MNAIQKMEPEVIKDAPAALTPMQMLSSALERGASVEMLDKLMTLNERWEATQARKAFDQAISRAKADIPAIVKNKKGHNDKRYADFAAVASVVDPILAKHGLSYRFRTTQTDKISVTCIVSHESGHYEENTLSGPADTSGNKNAIQAIGSTLTYLQRYSLMQSLGLAATDDDDGRAANGTVAADLISEEQANALRSALAFKNRTEADFCVVMKRERIEDLEAGRFQAALAYIQKLPEVASA